MSESIVKREINKLINKTKVLERFNDNTFFITGSTGYIGSQIIFVLLELNKLKGFNNNIYAHCRNKSKANSIYKNEINNKSLQIIQGDILEKIELNESIDYIIHCASNTQSKDFVDFPVETIKTNFCGTDNILKLAKNKKVKKMIYLSSLEIYGQIFTDEKVSENDYGFIDLTSPRSSYSESKRLSETLCCSYADQYGLDVVIARLTQTIGPGIDYNDNRVFAQFARSIIENKDIVLYTEGKTVRNYIYIYDVISALFHLLLFGKSGESYNVANEDTGISIYDMAKTLIENFGTEDIKIVKNINQDVLKLGYNPEIKIELDTTKIKELGWKAEVGIWGMYKNLIESMRTDYL